LAVLNFPRAVLIELGFIDHAGDRAAMLDEKRRLQACVALCDVFVS
jgi:N-acetylmuramoyl-L-alanine amidase